jgi:hypothetical protein
MMIFSGFLGFGIPILFWIGTIIFGSIMLRRGGGRPERFFITGAALNILGTILRIPLNYLFGWLHHGDLEESMIESVTFSAGLVVNVIGAAGILCLIYAFWLKFNDRKSEKPVSVEVES